jgi:hypothetical protein
VVPRHEVAQAGRDRQHPLAQRHGRQHAIDEVRRPFGHAPAAAARAEAPALAREGHEALEAAARAAQAREAVGEHAAGEKGAQLALDERRHAAAVAVCAGGLQELLQMVAHHGVQDAGGGGAGVVGRGLGQHPAGGMRGPCRLPSLPARAAEPSRSDETLRRGGAAAFQEST